MNKEQYEANHKAEQEARHLMPVAIVIDVIFVLTVICVAAGVLVLLLR